MSGADETQNTWGNSSAHPEESPSCQQGEGIKVGARTGEDKQFCVLGYVGKRGICLRKDMFDTDIFEKGASSQWVWNGWFLWFQVTVSTLSQTTIETRVWSEALFSLPCSLHFLGLILPLRLLPNPTHTLPCFILTFSSYWQSKVIVGDQERLNGWKKNFHR